MSTDENKKCLKYEELWKKNRHSIRSITNNSDNYNENYMKIKFISDYDIPLKNARTLQNGNSS